MIFVPSSIQLFDVCACCLDWVMPVILVVWTSPILCNIFGTLATGRALRAFAVMYFQIIVRVTEKLFCNFSTDLAEPVSGSSKPCSLTEPEDSIYRDHKSPTRVRVLRQINPDVMFDQHNY